MSSSGGKVFLVGGTAFAKALGQDQVWFIGGAGRGPLWLEQRELGREREARRAGRGEGSHSGPCGSLGDLGFSLQGGGSPGGWGEGEPWRVDPPPVLMGALWWRLWGTGVVRVREG